jgi:predicted transposase YdaD
LNKKQKYNDFDQKQVNNEKALAYFFAASRYPYNMINNDAFRNLLTQLDPKFNIPSLTKLTNHAIELENLMHEKIKDLLLNTSSVALTTDF